MLREMPCSSDECITTALVTGNNQAARAAGRLLMLKKGGGRLHLAVSAARTLPLPHHLRPFEVWPSYTYPNSAGQGELGTSAYYVGLWL